MAETMTTEHADFPNERRFRALVRELREIGYGRMAQIVDEEWRTDAVLNVPPSGRGILVICKECDTLIRYRTGKKV